MAGGFLNTFLLTAFFSIAQVASPFQAILDYEREHSIPAGYINFSISKGAPTGAWQRLERGEIALDAAFYRAFKADLERKDFWAEYWRRKADAVEEEQEDPTEDSSSSAAVVVPPPPPPPPPVPRIDAEKLFLAMMTRAQQPDPHMYPALQRLQASGKFKLAALSNNVIFPKGHVLVRESPSGDGDGIRNIFDIFVGSAHVGMRKPDRAIYEHTMEQMRRRWGRELQPEDVLFLDDIGANLKTARSLGMATIRVRLGRTDDAVRELEQATGLKLLDQAGTTSRL
jgi:epoxide hydrolase-like predicted phosphatase